MILAGRSQRRNPCEVRSSLSQSPSRCTRLQPAGQKTATGSFYASVRFVNEIRLSVMAGAASRLTMSITTGSGSIAAAVPIAGRPSPSFRCSLFLTRITAYWRAARHCCCAMWRAVAGTRRCRSSRTLIDYRCRLVRIAGRRRGSCSAILHVTHLCVSQTRLHRISGYLASQQVRKVGTGRCRFPVLVAANQAIIRSYRVRARKTMPGLERGEIWQRPRAFNHDPSNHHSLQSRRVWFFLGAKSLRLPMQFM